MSRPSARRRPTALKLTETDQKYVLTASIATHAAFAIAVYLYQYTRSDNGTSWISLRGCLCAGVLLCCSAIQKQYYPLKGDKQPREDSPSLLQRVTYKDGFPILLGAICILSKFGVIEHLGPARSVALLLPIEGLQRARRGGFMRSNQTGLLMGGALVVCGVTDYAYLGYSSINSIALGYAWLLVTVGTTSLLQNMQYHSGDLSFWSGIVVLVCGILGCALMRTIPVAIPDVLVVLLLVASNVWQPTQPKAISTALAFAWPTVISFCLLVSFSIVKNVGWLQCTSFGGIYVVLLFSIRTIGVASSAQTAANVSLPRQKSWNHATYYITEIMAAKESRDIFYFLLLNLSFMVVQMLYGIWTNSLGLISDSIHMFFDCLALGVGLVAAVMSKWPASQNHPFGFAKVEIISGFANGIFLVLISVSIMIEAFERLLEPPDMKTDQLLLISTLGLCVNLVGIFAFNHGHHHHHGHAHSHSHEHSHEHDSKSNVLPNIHTPQPKQTDFSSQATGLRSPLPDFLETPGIDSGHGSPVAPSFGVSLRDIDENVLAVPRDSKIRSTSPYRSRSPVRRPGSPLKFALHSNLPDVSEIEADHSSSLHSIMPLADSPLDMGIHQLSSNIHLDRHEDHPHHNHNHNHNHSHNHNKAHTHTEDHDHKVHEHKHTTHSRTSSYDLNAGHTHDHNTSHNHVHPHAHGHDHSHNMEGIFLHILADTLGSGGVIVSTLMIRWFGWTGFDPLASIFIAVLIFLSVIPLLKSSFGDLLLTLHNDQEYTLREVLGKVSLIGGVSGIPFIRFWLDGQQQMHGILTIRAGIDGDTDLVRQKVRRKLQDGVPNLADVIVQVDRAD